MKTLSEDITLQLPTTMMQSGYVNTQIYHNGLGIFTGHSFIQGNNSSLYVNVNDFVKHNHGKNDRLKLNDDGELVSTPLDNGGEVPKRWEDGQVGNYRVQISQNTSTYGTVSYSASTNAVCGYDYVNKDIRPAIIENDADSEIGRLLQGTNWQVIHEDERGNFTNTLLPRVPNRMTKKFGVGLHIWTDQPNREYSLRTLYGREYDLGPADCLNGSNQTFVTLADLYWSGIAAWGDDTSLFLKYQGTSGDEFGDWEEGYDGYYGTLTLDSITVYGDTAHSTITIGTFTSGAEFNSYLQRYMDALETGWNYNALVSGNRVVYTTGMKSQEAQVTSELNTEAARFPLVGVDPEPSESEYLAIVIQPNFSQNVHSSTVPDKYIGNCPIAIMDGCWRDRRYYLAWMDRYGDYMSQPFEGKSEYSESFTKTEIQDYKNRRRVISNEVKPSWKLSTGWIKEDIYPYYEAIFTSPYLLLYDAITDMAWNVIVTDNKYTEKNYKNQKGLISLQITVESSKNQNYIF